MKVNCFVDSCTLTTDKKPKSLPNLLHGHYFFLRRQQQLNHSRNSENIIESKVSSQRSQQPLPIMPHTDPDDVSTHLLPHNPTTLKITTRELPFPSTQPCSYSFGRRSAFPETRHFTYSKWRSDGEEIFFYPFWSWNANITLQILVKFSTRCLH